MTQAQGARSPHGTGAGTPPSTGGTPPTGGTNPPTGGYTPPPPAAAPPAPPRGGAMRTALAAAAGVLMIIFAFVAGLHIMSLQQPTIHESIKEAAPPAPPPLRFVENGKASTTKLGTVAHYSGGELSVPDNGVLIAVGDLYQNGEERYKIYRPGSPPFSTDGLDGAVKIIKISGTSVQAVNAEIMAVTRALEAQGITDP